MQFVAIMQHTPTQCPGHVRELFDEVSATMPRMGEIEQKHGTKTLGIYGLLASHRALVLMDAPSYDAVEEVLYESGLMGWNTTEIAQATPIEDAMKMAAERFGVGG